MKKFVKTIVILVVLCTAFTFTACGLGYDTPNIDAYDLSGATNSGITGVSTLTFSPLTLDKSHALKLEEVNHSITNEEDKWSDKYYTNTLRLSLSEDGKMVERHNDLTYVNAIVSDSLKPSNWADFLYVSNAMPKDIYETDYLYTLKRKSTHTNPGNMTRPLDFVTSGSEWIQLKLFDFLRYTYLQSGGKVNLAITYDTSFNYQTDDFGGGIVIRAKVEVISSEITTNTLSDLLYAKVGQDTLLGVFNKTGHKLGIKPISDINLVKDASTWCDIQIGIPNIPTSADGLWNYMLYYCNQI